MNTKNEAMGFLAIEQGEVFFELWNCFAKGESGLTRIELVIDACEKSADAIATIHFASNTTQHYHFKQGKKLAKDMCNYLQISASNASRIEIDISFDGKALACTAKVIVFVPASFNKFEWQDYGILIGKPAPI